MWNICKFINMMSQMDIGLLDEISFEKELNQLEVSPEEKKQWNKIQVAILSGIVAASSIALTGAIVLLCKRHDGSHKAA